MLYKFYFATESIHVQYTSISSIHYSVADILCFINAAYQSNIISISIFEKGYKK